LIIGEKSGRASAMAVRPISVGNTKIIGPKGGKHFEKIGQGFRDGRKADLSWKHNNNWAKRGSTF
jgi:hypothetical protein